MNSSPTPSTRAAQVGSSHQGESGHTPDDLLQLETITRGEALISMIRFNRPGQRNPIDKDTIAALRAVLEQLTSAEDGPVPDAIVLTGNGTSFSAGGDLKGYQWLYRDPVRFRRFMEDFDAVCAILESCRPLTVSMINGACVAGGLEISLACDLITISSEARVGDGHLRFAQLPGAGGSQRLVRAIGLQHARHWLLTGKLFDAETAHRVGLAVLVAEPDELLDATCELIEGPAQLTPLGRHRMKDLISIAQRNTLQDGLKLEMDLVHEYATTSFDATEGLHAFAERRPARYRGE